MKKSHAAWIMILALPVASFAMAADLLADLVSKEKAQWTAWQKKDAAAFSKLASEDYVSTATGGKPIVGLKAYLKDMAGSGCDLHSVTLHEESLQQVSKDVVILYYTAVQDGACAGKKLPEHIAASSIWKQENGKWWNVSYHESPIP